jgi:ElaB/YqjD/DUF883 family membrane-anchored ribosome-binding protein
MQETRTALTEKLEALEQQVVDTVQGARDAVTETVTTVREAVEDTVDTVKDSVQETVETVKETLDLRHHVEQYPWAMVGGSVALGYVSGYFFDRVADELIHAVARRGGLARPPVAAFPHRNGGPVMAHASASAAPELAAGRSWMEGLADKFHDEIGQLKGLAIGAAVGVVRDLLTESTPEHLRGQVTEFLDGVTTKLGGQPVRGPVLSESRFSQEAGARRGTFPD